MFAANTYTIRPADQDDTFTLRRLADRNRLQPLTGEVLIGEIDGRPMAAISLRDGRVLADAAPRTNHLVANLRIRALAVWAHEATPSLRERMLKEMAGPTDHGERNEPEQVRAHA